MLSIDWHFLKAQYWQKLSLLQLFYSTKTVFGNFLFKHIKAYSRAIKNAVTEKKKKFPTKQTNIPCQDISNSETSYHAITYDLHATTEINLYTIRSNSPQKAIMLAFILILGILTFRRGESKPTTLFINLVTYVPKRLGVHVSDYRLSAWANVSEKL